jgi:hypothetical protein
MKRLLNPQFGLILVFLGMVGSTPLIQVALETSRDERPQALEIFGRKPTARNLRQYERSMEDSSWLAEKLRPWAHYIQFAWLKDGGDKALVGRDGWLFYGPGVHYLTQRPAERLAPSTATDAVAAIIDLRDQLAARGIRLLVMPVPNKETVYPEKLTRRAAGLPPSLCPDTKEVLSRLKAAEVEVLDLFELFTAGRATGVGSSPPLYLAQDSHWSPAGVDLAAQAVARRLLRQRWVEPGLVAYELRSAPTRRIGDILRMLQVPQLESDALAESVPSFRVRRADTGEAYRDDAGSDVLVLGDSFLRIYQTDEPGAGGFIARLAFELKQPVISIVNDGGASTLVRQELSRRPAWLAKKKVVIWEFVERDIRLGTEGWQRAPLPPAITAQAGEQPTIPSKSL